MKTKKESEEKLAGHTPGPWKLDGYNVESHDSLPIAIVRCPSTWRKSETVEADCRLIAAAPELLQALKDTLTICLTRGQALGLDDQGPVLDYAREQISKAERTP